MRIFVVLALISQLMFLTEGQCMAVDITKVTEVEGITEYQLDNGMRVLLFPDKSKETVTVNITYLVGSRHEGYGETGMAHLLEHMLFKGTPKHGDIPKELKDRGASMNGTTSFDRTNYYETMPATKENLEFGLELEADRMVNSKVLAEDLASEMTVVRNEFERGENSPIRVLMQRVMSSSYEWHNYGKSTIGNRTDIERVPIQNLRDFYRRFYQPDNAVLVVAGKFDEAFALAKIDQYFGAIPRPDRKLNKTYTEEPEQDGERRVAVRRVGDVGTVGAAFHIPAGSSPEFPAVDIASSILSTQPSGRLYKSLVESKQAVAAFSFTFALHDPGVIFVAATVPRGGDLDAVEKTLLETVSGLATVEITQAEVKRAKAELLKQWDDAYSNSQSAALSLSDWAAQGDWRLMFLHRDRLEKVTIDDVKAAASKYFVLNNCTIGQFIPTEEASRVSVPPRPDLKEMVADYKGRKAMAAGEEFEPTIENINQRTNFGTLSNGVKYALLPKKTRGEVVQVTMRLNFGSPESLIGKSATADLMASLLGRGSQTMNYGQIDDRLTELKANLRFSGSAGTINVSAKTRREYLPELMKLMKEVLRNPSFPEDQFEILKQQSITNLESGLTDPQALALKTLSRKLSPYPATDVRYVPTMEEEQQRIEAVTIEDVKTLFNEQVSGQYAQVAAVGDFDPEVVVSDFEAILGDWKSTTGFERITSESFNLKGETISINTPDKANAVYIAGSSLPISSKDPNYPAMVLGNYILGGSGGLSNRLANRVRQQEGLSYTVGSQFRASNFAESGSFTVFAITNPDNRDKLVATIAEEVEKIRQSGVTVRELDEAVQGYLESANRSRTEDGAVAGMLIESMETDRTLDFYSQRENDIKNLPKEKVDSVLKDYIDPSKIIIVTAGDFEKSKGDKQE